MYSIIKPNSHGNNLTPVPQSNISWIEKPIKSFRNQFTQFNYCFMEALSTRTAAPCATRVLRFLLLLFSILSVTAFSSGGLLAQATVTTDQPDYAPRSNAVFTGNDMLPGIALKIERPPAFGGHIGCNN